MKRSILQIAVSVDAEGSTTTLVLADDGTLWEGYYTPDYTPGRRQPEYVFAWRQLPELPTRSEQP